MVQAGELRERVTILSLVENPDGTGWDWQEGKTTWAKVEQTGKRSLFSTVGAGREEWRATMRQQPLTLHQALRWRGRGQAGRVVAWRARRHRGVPPLPTGRGRR